MKKSNKGNKKSAKNKVDKKLNQIQSKIENVVQRINVKPRKLSKKITISPGIGNRFDVNPMSLLGKGMADKFRVMKVAEYLFGATHPKYAVENMLDVKLPTDLPVPTACIRVTKTVQLQTGATGIIMLNYVPGTLIRTNFNQGQISPLTYNTTCNGNGSAGVNNYTIFDSSNLTQVWDKWRLTASEMSLRYNGKVLDQSGSMFSCVHYEPSSIAYKGVSGTGNIALLANSNVDRLSGDFTLVKQGLWNSTIDLTQNGAGITHIWTPSSPLDYFFTGTSGITGTDSNVIHGNVLQIVSATNNAATHTTTYGSVRQFVWAAENLPINTNCLLFEVHEVYEYIPDISVVGILKPSTERPTAMEYNSVVKEGFVQPEVKPLKSGGFLPALQKAVANLSREVDMPKVLTTIGKGLISLI